MTRAALGCLLFLSVEAHAMSGAYSVQILEPRYLFGFEEHARKIFRDAEQARSFFAEHDRAAKAAFLAGKPALDAFVTWSASQGVTIAPAFDPFLHSFEVKSAEQLTSFDAAAFPLTVSVPAKELENATQWFAVTLSKPVPAKSAAEWLKRAAQLTTKPVEEDDGHILERAGFERPIVAFRASTYFAVSVGVTFTARAEVAKGFLQTFTSRLEAGLPALEARMHDAASTTEASGIHELLPITQSLGGAPTVTSFNPHGPLLDSHWRTRVELGSASVIVLFTPVKALAAEQPGFAFNQWLTAQFETAHDEALRLEELFFQARFGDEGEKERALDALRANRSPRYVELLSSILLRQPDPNVSSSLVEAAARQLGEVDSPVRKTVLLKVAQRQKPPDALRVVAEGLAQAVKSDSAPDKAVIEALVAIWNNQALEWGQRYPARDAVKSMLDGWADTAAAAKVRATMSNE